MAHFIEGYAEKVNDILHDALGGTLFYRQEVLEVPGLLVALLITYDGVRDDSREIHLDLTWETFLERMSRVKPDWQYFDRQLMEQFLQAPHKVMGGWEGRTVYFIKGGRHPGQWTKKQALDDVPVLLTSSSRVWGPLVQAEVDHLREIIPVGREHFRDYERMVRIAFTFAFREELGAGREQSRTEPENEGIEIRDLVFSNIAVSGFWKDLKDKYSATEIVVDAKNMDELTRDDLRQLYCYLKPALGLWGFIVCRSPQPKWIHAFNRTLFKNFAQCRGVLILSDDDLRRMVTMANRGQQASAYLRDRMSEFAASV